jgi:beta-glucoside operon transcriptional antiterminator
VVAHGHATAPLSSDRPKRTQWIVEEVLMMLFRVNRVINNNVISVLEDDREVILTGRGLGYQQHPGGTYDPTKVERRFVLDDDRSAEGFTSVIAEIPYEVLVLSNQIADHLKATLDLTLSSAMQLGIADHIQFAMQRLAAGQRLEHAMLWELKSTYRREFTAALEILDMIRAQTGVGMPVDEAAFLTMHLVNAELNGDMSTTLSTTSAVQDIVSLVRDQLGVPLEPDSVAYARFLTHVKFAVRRIEDGQLLVGTDLTLYDMVRVQDPDAHTCAMVIAGYVRDRYGLDLPEEELLYLMVHVNRLRHRDVATS